MRLIVIVIAALSLAAPGAAEPHVYLLGPDDQILVRALEVAEFPDKPLRVDERGLITLPLVGEIEAGGKTIRQLEAEISSKLKKYLHEPEVTVSISEFRSRPVSVFGAVSRPGVMQLRGPKTLWEVISEAGGFKNEAGDRIRITRSLEHGPIPLDGATIDETGKYSIVEIDTRSVMEMTNPAENIEILAHDVISVSQADVVYVVGHVNRAGGFVTNGSISVIEALALAGGFKEFANQKEARILRVQPGSEERIQIAINLKRVLKAEDEDVALRPQDILFIPHAGMKEFGSKTMSMAIAAATHGIFWNVWR